MRPRNAAISAQFGLLWVWTVETAAPKNKNLWDARLNTQQVLRFVSVGFSDAFFGKKVLRSKTCSLQLTFFPQLKNTLW
jgi:hypothetical protein